MIELDKLSLDQIIGEEIELIPLMNEEDEKKFNKEAVRSEEHTSELQSRGHLVCRLLLEKKNRGKGVLNDVRRRRRRILQEDIKARDPNSQELAQVQETTETDNHSRDPSKNTLQADSH